MPHPLDTAIRAALVLLEANDEAEGNSPTLDEATILLHAALADHCGFDFWVDDGTRLVETSIDLPRAAYLSELDEADVRWAIEEHGRCDTQHGTVVPAGQPAPGKWEGWPPDTGSGAP